MPLPTVPEHEILSFRHVFESALQRFLIEENLGFDDAASGLAEVLFTLWRHREEGVALYPTMFITDDLEAMLACLDGRNPLRIGRGPRNATTLRAAVKQCAPLTGGGWSIYMLRRADCLEYGLFRNDDLLLSPGPMARLRSLSAGTTRIMGIAQLADNVLELRGSGGARRLIYLSGAPAESRPVIALIHQLASLITSDVDEELRDQVRTFWLRVLLNAMRGAHGSLIAVLPVAATASVVFSDGITLDAPIDVAGLVRAYQVGHHEECRASLQGAGSLIEGMLGVDGITVLRSDGAVVAYNAFLRLPEPTKGEVSRLGGARRRAFGAMTEMVGTSLLAAFVRSQDGPADIAVAPCAG